MGEVYLARDTRLGRAVAVKVLPSTTATNPESRQRFEREARTVASLNHPHICTLYDFGSQGDVHYIVMERLEGETLAQRLTKGALPLDRAFQYAIEIAGALDAAHRAGIIHRDLKPSNIMLTAAGAKLLDFGLAKIQQSEAIAGRGLDTISPRALTLTGVIVGTLQYMSPEQVKGLATDARSDIFSFGAVVFEMVSGRRAFQAADQRNLIGAILDTEPPSLSTLQPLVPPAFERLVRKCLAKDPNDRWQTTRDLVDELAWSMAPVPGPAAAGPAWRKRLLFVAPAVVAMAALLAVWSWTREPGEPAPAPGLSGHRLVTDYRGSHGWGSFSPDGKMMAYTSDADGSDQVWIKNLAAGDPIQLTFGQVGVGRLAWSPAGDQIVFARAGGQGIWSVAPLGGPPRRLLELGNRPKFSRDGRRITFERDGEIWVANADGSDPRRVYEPAPSSHPSLPALSPEGESLVFFLSRGNGPLGDYWVLPLSGGPARQLTFDDTAGGSAAWTPDGRSIVFPSARGGSLTLWHIAVDGGAPRPLTFGAGSDTDPDISADGRRLLYTNQRSSSALVVTDALMGRREELLERQSNIFGGRFSAAGDRIAFFYQVDTGVHVFTVGVDGRELRQVTHGTAEVNAFPSWSRDGTHLYFFRQKPAVSFMKVSATGGKPIEVGPWSLANRVQVDPEGTRVVFERGDGEVTDATIIRDLASGRETILPVALRFPRWTANGQAVIGTQSVSESDGQVRQRIVTCATDGPCHPLTEGSQPVPSGDGSRVFFLRPSPSGAPFRELWSIDRDGRNDRQHGTLGPFLVSAIHYDVSIHHQVVWAVLRSGENRIWMSEFR
jgi:Tol biopolymer transport system component